ncbi:WhiB family transcriptional regulator [Rhodococcus sp. HNM0569]|uniref:WhiB family transcriptional regulator n=1 Tax=Rhodococcus sp. HNM0569 TaxID=2716340 RepID=UPI00146CC849|nr:WhiB family transcriptional regulator [Rhodococcus sp. HNM0569]NLU83966.1 WhiB family transcriptional regulator [Rhodococcus sp. HNM0569]
MPRPKLVPLGDIWEWQQHGKCQGMDSAVFFPPTGERGKARADRERAAKQICFSCPVVAQCRRHALEVQEPFGVWGGMGESERIAILRRRRRDRSAGAVEPAA